jgi:hypothetical protein
MQGHLEAPRLWEKHAKAILHELGLQSMAHEPCQYSGTINENADILLDMLDDKLNIPINQQGYLDMYNGRDVLKTHDYIKYYANCLWRNAVKNTSQHG